MREFKPKNAQSLNSTEYGNKEALFDAETSLVRYNSSIVSVIARYFNFSGNFDHTSLVDFGAGGGSLAEIFRDNYEIYPTCIEVDSDLVTMLRKKGFEVFSTLDQIQSQAQFIYTSNVLEHIEDDQQALIKLRESMASAGKIAIYVPALPYLFSDLDRRAGHFRRYTKRSLIHKVKAAGFTVDKCFYNDSLGVPASLALRILGYRNSSGLGSIKSLEFYDKIVYPVSQILDYVGFKYFFGKNLFLFASVET